jgi:tripartite-type tricarboxylate transporter receptor subunit TctC
MITRRRFMTGSAACLAFGSICAAPHVFAQAVRRPARMLVGMPPGGTLDFIARLLVNEMRGYASSIIVDNRPGAGGRVALDTLKSSIADGSAMILIPASWIALYPHIYKTLKYNPFQDFIPVTTVCSVPYLISVGPMVPGHVKSLADFITWCRANPRQATYGTPAAGSPLHFTGFMLTRAAGFEFIHVPYQGGATAVQNLLGGQIAATILPLDNNTLPYIQSGDFRALVTTGPRRSAFIPDVPTVREAGYPALEAVEWIGILVPAKTPAGMVNNLNSAIREVLKTDEFKASLAKLSVEIAGASPSDFAKLIRADFERWGLIVKASGFAPED